MIFNFIDHVNTTKELPMVMQNIGLALITIFIPVALFLFEKNDDNNNFKVLDKAVILDHLVDARNLIWKIALIFVPLLLWDIESCLIRIIIFILWAVGVWLVVSTLSKSYNWIRKGKFQYRFNYLKKIKNGSELEDLWRSVWETSGTNSQNEIEFFKIFSVLVDKLYLDKENIVNLNLVAKLLNDFQIFVKKRSFIFLTAKDDVFQKVLEWHFTTWQREYEYMIREDKLNEFSGYGNISSILDSIVRSVTERALKDEMAYGFFKLIETHIESHKKDFVINAPHLYSYVESFLAVFYNSFFSNIENARDRFDIWQHYFPKSWLVTKENITDKENAPARVTMNNFFIWAQNRIKLPKKGEMEFDTILDSVSREMFPTTEPFFWATMLTLLMRAWGDNDRMQTLVEYPRSFGYVGRIHMSWYEDHDDDKAIEEVRINRDNEIENSIKLLLTLFPYEFTKEKLDEYIAELESFKYEKEDKNYDRKEQLLFYIKEILKVVNVKDK